MSGSNEETLQERIQDLGKRIIECNQKCDGVNTNQEAGYYPRAFLLQPENASCVEVAIVGENPGNSDCLEREAYRIMAERRESGRASLEDCQRIWNCFLEEGFYYLRPRHLLKQLGLSRDAVLWAEAVFCEEKPGSTIPDETFKKCGARFLKEIVKLVPKGRHIICLGEKAYDSVSNFENNQHKVIGVYHPSGRRSVAKFAKYFEEGTNKQLTKRKIKKEVVDAFKKLEGSGKKSYYVFLTSEPPFFIQRSTGMTRERKLPHRFESVCTLNGCEKKFIIDRTSYRKPTDDPRILHLRKDHGLEGETRLRKRFRNISKG